MHVKYLCLTDYQFIQGNANLAVKDFVWRKDPKRGWVAHCVPLGEGMVRFAEALKRITELRFSGPISLHVEYVDRMAPVGSEKDKAKLAAIRKDNDYLRNILKSVDLL